jgi:hypothetical protein
MFVQRYAASAFASGRHTSHSQPSLLNCNPHTPTVNHTLPTVNHTIPSVNLTLPPIRTTNCKSYNSCKSTIPPTPTQYSVSTRLSSRTPPPPLHTLSASGLDRGLASVAGCAQDLDVPAAAAAGGVGRQLPARVVRVRPGVGRPVLEPVHGHRLLVLRLARQDLNLAGGTLRTSVRTDVKA